MVLNPCNEEGTQMNLHQLGKINNRGFNSS